MPVNLYLVLKNYHNLHGSVAQHGKSACLRSRMSWVQIPPDPYAFFNTILFKKEIPVF